MCTPYLHGFFVNSHFGQPTNIRIFDFIAAPKQKTKKKQTGKQSFWRTIKRKKIIARTRSNVENETQQAQSEQAASR